MSELEYFLSAVYDICILQTADCRPGVKCRLRVKLPVFGWTTVTFQQTSIHKPLDILKSSTKIECLSQTRLDT